MLSGRGLCDELITRPEESYRLCCVVVCNLETSRMGAPYIYDISHLRVNIVLQSENMTSVDVENLLEELTSTLGALQESIIYGSMSESTY